MQFLNWIFDYQSFMPRHSCGYWSVWLVDINQLSNFAIFLSYMAISLMLAYLWYIKRREIPSHWIVLCFMSFIFWCGLTHLCNVIAFSIAPYRLFTLVDCVTAFFSVITAILLPMVIRSASHLRSYIGLVKQMEKEVELRKQLERMYKEYQQRRLHRQQVVQEIVDSYDNRPENVPEKLRALLVEYQNETGITDGIRSESVSS